MKFFLDLEGSQKLGVKRANFPLIFLLFLLVLKQKETKNSRKHNRSTHMQALLRMLSGLTRRTDFIFYPEVFVHIKTGNVIKSYY